MILTIIALVFGMSNWGNIFRDGEVSKVTIQSSNGLNSYPLPTLSSFLLTHTLL